VLADRKSATWGDSSLVRADKARHGDEGGWLQGEKKTRQGTDVFFRASPSPMRVARRDEGSSRKDADESRGDWVDENPQGKTRGDLREMEGKEKSSGGRW